MVSYKCNTCAKIFYHKSDYTKHLSRKRPCSVILVTPESLKCIDCGKSYDTPYNFSRHRQRSGHNSIIDEKSVPIDNSLDESPKKHSNDSKSIPGFGDEISNTNLQNNQYANPLLTQLLSQQYTQPGVSKEYYNSNMINEFLNKKLPVQPIITEIDGEYKNIYTNNHVKSYPNSTQLDPININMDMDIEIDMDIDGKSSGTFHCEYCNRKYVYNYNLNKHLKSCQAKTKLEQKDIVVKSLLEKMDKMHDNMNKMHAQYINNNSHNNSHNTNTTNNTNNTVVNNNNNINVNLCAFGEEDLSFISDSKLRDIMSKGYDGVKYIIEYVHFNKNKPEYHNIYLPSLHEKHVNIYDGYAWVVEDKKIAMEKLIDNKLLFLEEKYEELEDTLPNSTKSKFARVLEYNQEKVQRAKITNEIRYILFNKKAMVILTKNKVYENEINNLIG